MDDYDTEHIFLISNASMDMYPDNKPQDFTNVLPKPLNVSGKWMLALRSITYPGQTYDLTSKCVIKLHHKDPLHTLPPIPVTFEPQEIKDLKSFCSIVDSTLWKAIESDPYINVITIKPLETRIKINYNERTRKVSILSTDNIFRGISFHESLQLAKILGFDYELNKEYPIPLEGKKPASAREQRPGFFVYCDAIKPGVVGDTFAQGLAYIPFNGEGPPFKEYINLSYYGLESNNVNKIHISLRDTSGECIVFPAGQTVIHCEVKGFRRS